MDAAYYRQMAEDQKSHWWYEGRRRILARLISRLDLPHNAQILEAGCGPGANLNMLKNFGDVSALEPDSFAVENAKAVSNLDVQQGGLPEPFPTAFTDTRYDFIGAFDVVEHIDDHISALKTLRHHLKEGGQAIFTVPAHQWLWSHHDEINNHKRRYSRRQFKAALKEAGFTIESISYYNMWLFPLAISVRFLKKLLGAKEESDVAMPSAPVNAFLRFIFASERFLLPVMRLPFGLSIIAVCRK